MRTFFTSSLFGVLCAVLLAWALVRFDEDATPLPPVALPAPPAEIPEEPPIPVKPVSLAEEAPPEPEMVETGPVDASSTPDGEPVSLEGTEVTAASEFIGPPAPVREPKAYLPFVLNIAPSTTGLMLQGSIPTREGRDALVEAASLAAGEGEVDSRLRFSPETMTGEWAAFLPGYVERFFQYTGGNQDLTVVDGKLMLRGAVVNEEAEKALIAWTKPLRDGGLKLVNELDVDPALKGEVKEIPEELAKIEPKDLPAPEPVVEVAETSVDPPAAAPAAPAAEEKIEDAPTAEEAVEVVVVDPPTAAPEAEEKIEEVTEEEEAVEVVSSAGVVEEVPEPPGVEMVYYGPDDGMSDEELAAILHTVPWIPSGEAVPKKSEDTVYVSISESKEKDVEDTDGEMESDPVEVAAAAGEAPKDEEPLIDDGKPLIFYFDTGSSEIAATDRDKIKIAIQRASRPRSIVYITGYADYRGSFELNKKLTLARANRVKDAIFAGDIADEVTAEVTAKADDQSEKIDVGKRDDDESLRRSRRVVVEVYHLRS